MRAGHQSDITLCDPTLTTRLRFVINAYEGAPVCRPHEGEQAAVAQPEKLNTARINMPRPRQTTLFQGCWKERGRGSRAEVWRRRWRRRKRGLSRVADAERTWKANPLSR